MVKDTYKGNSAISEDKISVRLEKDTRTLRDIFESWKDLKEEGIDEGSRHEAASKVLDIINNRDDIDIDQDTMDLLYPLSCYIKKEEFWVIENNTCYDELGRVIGWLNDNLEDTMENVDKEDEEWEEVILKDMIERLSEHKAVLVANYIKDKAEEALKDIE